MNNGGPAFPGTEFFDERPVGHFPGMTLRDYFAAAALQGIVTHEGVMSSENPKGLIIADNAEMAESAYLIADAMLKIRNKLI